VNFAELALQLNAPALLNVASEEITAEKRIRWADSYEAQASHASGAPRQIPQPDAELGAAVALRLEVQNPRKVST